MMSAMHLKYYQAISFESDKLCSPDDGVHEVSHHLWHTAPDVRDAQVKNVLLKLCLTVSLLMACDAVSDRTIAVEAGTLDGEAGADGYVVFRFTVLKYNITLTVNEVAHGYHRCNFFLRPIVLKNNISQLSDTSVIKDVF